VTDVRFPPSFQLERLRSEHLRRRFRSGQAKVDVWLATKSLQHQAKRLSITKVLLDDTNTIAGCYTLATGQVDFSDLPPDLAKRLQRRVLPAAVLAWLGVSSEHQGQGLGARLLAQALRDCWEAGKIFPFIAVIIDCVDNSSKSFYKKWGFAELPGHPLRLYLRAHSLDALIQPM
jgi:GNAT superfamily N-acetyltransferase